jgi:hypothetical protein
MVPPRGFEPLPSDLKDRHPDPIRRRREKRKIGAGSGNRTRIFWVEASGSAFELRPRRANENVAESAGVEPARPEGLAALAPRCLAARPTLHVWVLELSAGLEPAQSRSRNPALFQLSYESIGVAGGTRTRMCSLCRRGRSRSGHRNMIGSRSRIRTCIATVRASGPAVRRSWKNSEWRVASGE